MKLKTSDMVIIAVFSALISVFSLITIPTPFGIPITLQTFIIAVAGFTLGSAKGFASTAVYIAVGIVGLPVFSGFQGGFSALFGMTGGFIVGFIPLVIFCGMNCKNSLFRIFLGITGLLVCHLCGVLWVSFITGNILTAFLTVSVPYLVKDIISVVFALFISKKLSVIIQKFN